MIEIQFEFCLKWSELVTQIFLTTNIYDQSRVQVLYIMLIDLKGFEGWGVPWFTRSKHRDMMMQSSQIQGLRKSWIPGLVSEKKDMRARSSWYLGTGRSWCHSFEGKKGKTERESEGQHESVLLLMLPRPSVIEFCLPLQWWWVFIFQSTCLNASLFWTRHVYI